MWSRLTASVGVREVLLRVAAPLLGLGREPTEPELEPPVDGVRKLSVRLGAGRESPRVETRGVLGSRISGRLVVVLRGELE